MPPKATLPSLLLTAATGCTSGAEDDTALDCSEPGTVEAPNCLNGADGQWSLRASTVFVRTNPESGATEAAAAAASVSSCGGEDRLLPLSANRYEEICQDVQWWGSDYLVSCNSVDGQLAEHSLYSLYWTDLTAEDAAGLRGARSVQVGYRNCYDTVEGDVGNTHLYDTFEWTDGALTIVDIDANSATLDFDFDGARGRITASVCTVDGTEW